MERLIELFRNKLTLVPTQLSRSLMSEIVWDAKLIGIKGARGVGKTTLMLQYIKQHLLHELNATLYVTLDHLWFTENTLVDLADTFVKRGGKYLFLDEVHKYENWTQELKNIYDSYPTLKVIFTGSSLLQILNARADLSRRALVYHLQGLSFREYLILHTNNDFKKYSLNTILNQHNEISAEVLQHISPLAYFDEYLKKGYFPFHLEQPNVYYMRINEILSMMLEIELPLLRNVDVAYIARVKQLLYIISQAIPFVPNVSKLSEKIGIERKTLLTYLHYLDEIALTRNLFKESFGISSLQKPQKIYLENTNYMYALSSETVNKGNLRETFFANQLKQNHVITYTNLGDFLVDNKYTFEIGGKSKNNKQIKDVSNSYIAADDIEYGFGNKIPLWLFGFLY